MLLLFIYDQLHDHFKIFHPFYLLRDTDTRKHGNEHNLTVTLVLGEGEFTGEEYSGGVLKFGITHSHSKNTRTSLLSNNASKLKWPLKRLAKSAKELRNLPVRNIVE